MSLTPTPGAPSGNQPRLGGTDPNRRPARSHRRKRWSDYPQEVPGAFNDWYTWATTIKNTTKHITGGMLGARCVKDAARMGAIALGSEEQFRERPFISGWVLTLPPFGIDTESLDALMEMSRWKIPVILSSGPILGTSSPVTIAGTVAQAHAEILGCHRHSPIGQSRRTRGVHQLCQGR